jgi:hypothetical protein
MTAVTRPLAAGAVTHCHPARSRMTRVFQVTASLTRVSILVLLAKVPRAVARGCTKKCGRILYWAVN